MLTGPPGSGASSPRNSQIPKRAQPLKTSCLSVLSRWLLRSQFVFPRSMGRWRVQAAESGATNV